MPVATLRTTTSASLTTAPLESVTTPRRLAPTVCARADPPASTIARPSTTTRRLIASFMVPLSRDSGFGVRDSFGTRGSGLGARKDFAQTPHEAANPFGDGFLLQRAVRDTERANVGHTE